MRVVPSTSHRQWVVAVAWTAAVCVGVGVLFAQTDEHISALVDKLSRGEGVFGVSTYDLSLENARALARADIDYVYVDMEHGAMDFAALQTFLLGMTDKRAVHDSGRLRQRVTPLARLAPYGREQTQWAVKQALDVGLMGIIFPAIDTAAQALNAVRAMRYPQRRGAPYVEPRGQRGSGPAAAAWFWGLSTSDYVRQADLWPLNPAGDLVAIMMIETAEGLGNVNAIAAVPGVAGFYIGPSDLSNSLGVPRDAPEVEAAIETIAAACGAHDIVCGITASAADMRRRTEQGFRMLGAGRAGGGLPASVDAALDAGRAAGASPR
jgi:4-hydroxy-2-oxoheptanedioate aldolase